MLCTSDGSYLHHGNPSRLARLRSWPKEQSNRQATPVSYDDKYLVSKYKVVLFHSVSHGEVEFIPILIWSTEQ
jgi:hypothetical protein